MNTQKKNIILVLVVGLILSVNYGAYAESVAAEEQLIGTDEKTKEIINLDETVDESENSNNKEEENHEETDENNHKNLEETNHEDSDEINETERSEDIGLEKENSKESDKVEISQDELEKKERLNSTEQSVENWEQFTNAFNDENVEKIILTDNIDGKSSNLKLEKRSKSLEITSLNNNKYRLTTTGSSTETGTLFDLVGLENDPVFTVRNLEIFHEGGHLIDASREKSSKWKIINDAVDVNLAASTESGIFKYYLNGDNIEKVQFINDNNINDADGFVLTPNAIVEINKAEVKSNDGISSKAITIVNSEVDVLEGAGGLVASDYIKIDNSNVRITTDYYGISVTDRNVQKENKLGLLVKNNSALTIENKEMETIDTFYTKITDSIINYVSGERGIVSDEIDFTSVTINGDTVKDNIMSRSINFTNVSGEIVSKTTAINARQKEEVEFNIYNSTLDIEVHGDKPGFAIDLGQSDNKHNVQLYVAGPESVVNVKSTKKNLKNRSIGGISIVSSYPDIGGVYPGIALVYEAKLNVVVENGPAVYTNIENLGDIYASLNSSLRVIQEESLHSQDAALVIEDSYESSLQSTEGSTIEVISKRGPAPAILYKVNTRKQIQALRGGKIKIYNSFMSNDDQNSLNANSPAIELLGEMAAEKNDDNLRIWAINEENSQEEISSIIINSRYGPVVKGKTILDLYSLNSIMDLSGNTKNMTDSLIEVPYVKIENSNSMYFNIENRRKGGGQLFPQLSSKSEFVQNIYGSEKLSAPFAVWEHGQDVTGEPSKYWSKLNFGLFGSELKLNATSHFFEFNTNEDSFGPNGLTPYSRISANNAKPIIDFAPDSYDTDKSIYGHVTVPEGLNGSRNAWEGEVQLGIERTQAARSKTVYDDISTHKSKEEAWGYEDYKIPKERWGGYFKLDLDDFAVAGDDYKIISAYRGQKDQEEERHIHSDLTESEVTKKTVIDRTPPKIATIESPVFEDQATMTGKTPEKGITAKLYDKDELEIKDKDGKPLEVSDVEGKWEFDISNTKLKKGDKVYVVLKDKEGNVNPFVKSTYHDATFEAAASIIISGPRFEISADDLFTNQKGIIKIENKDNLKVEMNAKGKDNLNDKEIEVEITDLGGLEFEQSETINEVKSHKITFKLKGEDTTVIKSVHILPYDNIEQNDKYVIGASDFYTDKKDIDANEDRVKELANAKAYKKEDMSEQDVRLKDFEKLQFDLPNKLEFVVEANEKVAITVIGRVLNYDHVNNSDKYVVAANDFSIMDYLAVDIEDQTILHRSKAAGWIIDGWQERDVKVVKHNVEGTAGQYKATIDIVK